MAEPPILNEALIKALRCPETKQPLRVATTDEIARANCQGLHAGLLREDGNVIYPIRDGFPILLTDEAIRLPENKGGL